MARETECTNCSLDLQGHIDGISCCEGTAVVLELSVDGAVVYQSDNVDAMGVELVVNCAEHSPNLDPDAYPAPPDGWVCFHCGNRFQKYGYALDHFGPSPDSMPACQMDYKHGLMELRKLESRIADLEGNK